MSIVRVREQGNRWGLCCIGLSTEERERIEDQGWTVADLHEMFLEEAMAALRVSREKAGRIMRCSSSTGVHEREGAHRASERASERVQRERTHYMLVASRSKGKRERGRWRWGKGMWRGERLAFGAWQI